MHQTLTCSLKMSPEMIKIWNLVYPCILFTMGFRAYIVSFIGLKISYWMATQESLLNPLLMSVLFLCLVWPESVYDVLDLHRLAAAEDMTCECFCPEFSEINDDERISVWAVPSNFHSVRPIIGLADILAWSARPITASRSSIKNSFYRPIVHLIGRLLLRRPITTL